MNFFHFHEFSFSSQKNAKIDQTLFAKIFPKINWLVLMHPGKLIYFKVHPQNKDVASLIYKVHPLNKGCSL
jgi:hypothetical protein